MFYLYDCYNVTCCVYQYIVHSAFQNFQIFHFTFEAYVLIVNINHGHHEIVGMEIRKKVVHVSIIFVMFE